MIAQKEEMDKLLHEQHKMQQRWAKEDHVQGSTKQEDSIYGLTAVSELLYAHLS